MALASGCNLYFEDAPGGGAPAADSGPHAPDDLALPCLRTLSTADVRADDGEQLFVSYSCEGASVIADVFHADGALIANDPRADFQQRFARVFTGDLDGRAPVDVLLFPEDAAIGWAFMRRDFGGGSGYSVDMGRRVDDVAIADLDGDGKSDFVVAGGDALVAFPDAVAMLNTFSAWPATALPVGAHGTFVSAAVAPLGGSAAPDVFFVAREANGSFGLGTAIQTGWDPAAFTVTKVAEPEGPLHGLRVADVDGDGIDDVIGLARRIFVRGSKHGRLAFLDEAAASLAIGDVDGDGRVEAVFITHAHASVRRVRVDASGATLALSSELLSSTGGDQVVVADVDDDGRGDLVLARDLGQPSSTLRLVRGPTF
ncbi:MAG: hypothetical protein H0X17_06880 [Deltaproteobacteria bacterium]|nr:hypothetical protein [Deltaproteobacteria bacterium]